MEKIISKNDFFNLEHFDPIYGSKAKGLYLLRGYRQWTPNFFIISEFFFCNPTDFSSLINDFTANISRLFTKEKFLILTLSFSISKKIILRSNVLSEDISCRGEFDSYIADNTYDDFISKLSLMVQVYLENKSSLTEFSVIVQEYISCNTIGHLSNERRVSERNRGWLIDYEQCDSNVDNETFKIFKNRYEPDLKLPEVLEANDFSDINKELHYPAILVTLFDTNQSRIHFEWIWDGKRVWIVQADNDCHQHGVDPASFMEDFKSNDRINILSLDYLLEVQLVGSSNFKKAKHQSIIKNAGLTPSNLFLLKANDYEENGSLVLESINTLLKLGPVVIRTDICSESYSQKERQNLSRSDSLSDISSIKFFLDTSVEKLINDNVINKNIVFLIHNYIPSLSSAFSYADPTNSRVRIDSIWGLPDGLQYYAHDSIEVDARKHYIIKEKKRFKGYMLGSSKNGDWLPSEICIPFDWRLSISKKDALYIAGETRKLAIYLKKPIKLMWFINTPENSSHPRNVPWYFEEMEIEQFDEYSKGNIYRIDDICISDEAGIECAKLKFIEKPFNKILLYPKESKIRDNIFLEMVSAFCTENDVTVIFMGSILQHAYYQLKKNKVKVSCLEPFEPKKSNVEYNKLVRDRIGEIIQNDGENPIIQNVSGDRLIELLEEKLAEEAEEVVAANDRVSRTEELADLLEVALKLCELEDISIKDVLKAMLEKRESRGGFNNGVFLIKSESRTAIAAEDAFSKISKKKKFRRNTGTQMPFDFK